MSSRVVLLNGVSSVSKTSVARALQELARRPLLHVHMDAFVEMVPSRMFNPDGAYLLANPQADGSTTGVTGSEVLARTMCGMRGTVAALVEAGNDVVVDVVTWMPEDIVDYRRRLEAFSFHAVALVAQIDVIEERERQRGDRKVGLARWQLDKVHIGMTYDLTLDTSRAAPGEVAAAILAACNL